MDLDGFGQQRGLLLASFLQRGGSSVETTWDSWEGTLILCNGGGQPRDPPHRPSRSGGRGGWECIRERKSWHKASPRLFLFRPLLFSDSSKLEFLNPPPHP